MVGILTFHRGPNHGGYLQVLELCRAIEKLGHEVEIIDYQNAIHAGRETFKPWIYRRPSSLWYGASKARAFARAKKHLNLSQRFTKKEEIDWERYETVLVGADVVWDYSVAEFGKEDIYFGGFRENFEGRLAAFAPSCGVANAAGPFPDYVKKGLLGFDHAAVRDEATQTLYRNVTGKDCSLVLDPTWLPFGEPLEKHTDVWDKKEPYIAVYGFKIDEASARAVRSYAQERGLKIYASGYYQPWADRNFPGLTPLEWVDFLNSSEVVFAGTFHGALYAMRLGKRCAFLSNDKIAQKLATPLKIIGLEDHMLNSPEDLPRVFDLQRDAEADQTKLESSLASSWSYLKEVIG